MADRDYKVTYKSRTRPVEDGRDYDYDYDHRVRERDGPRYLSKENDYDRRARERDEPRYLSKHDDYDYHSRRQQDNIHRGSKSQDYDTVIRSREYDSRDRDRDVAVATTRPRQSTRNEYDFLSDREEIFSRSTGSNVIVLDSRDDGARGGGLSEWEIVRPERGDDGVLYIDADDLKGGTRRYEVEGGGKRGDRQLEVIVASSGGGRERNRSLVDKMREVRVTEEEDREERRSVCGRRGQRDVVLAEAPMAPSRKCVTALRHDHSPSSDTRRRSRSIGFHRAQLVHHDVSECRHERPGAEAALAGRYLRGNTERVDDDDRYSYTGGGHGRQDRSRSRRRKHRSSGGDADYGIERREKIIYEERREVQDGSVERSRPYSPQRGISPEPEPEREKRRHRRHRRHHRRRDEKEVEVEDDEDDRRSYYSEHYRKTKRVYDD